MQAYNLRNRSGKQKTGSNRMMQVEFVIGSVLLLVAVVSLGYISIGGIKKPGFGSNNSAIGNVLYHDPNQPVMWLFYDTDEVNSRSWKDYGARSERALNMPFLNLCYDTIVSRNKDHYRIEVIGGLTGVAELLGGWDNMPSGLRNPLKPVRERELNWIRAAILSKYGGLWLCPYTICVKTFGKLPRDNIVFYGTDLLETYSGKEGTSVPGFRCIWSPVPEHPLFVEWEQICRARLEMETGGQEIRRDENWDWVALSSKYNDFVIDVHAEGSRRGDGRRIELEDLLSSGSGNNLPFALSDSVLFVPIPWPEIRRRLTYGWFLRMSEDQIMESDIAVRYIIG